MDNRFTLTPQISQERSTFKRTSQHKTTFNSGQLVPIYIDEVLPGDTFNMNMTALIRSTTPKVPVMDNAYADTYAFFVPSRLIWDHHEEFFGANKHDEWTQTHKYTIPQLRTSGSGRSIKSGSIADHLGLPVHTDNVSVNHLPIRAYCLIWNEFFRDQNTQKPILIDKGDSDTIYTHGFDIYASSITGGMLLPINKYQDYFTSALREPQKGADVVLPLYANGKQGIPVIPTSDNHQAMRGMFDNPLMWQHKVDGRPNPTTPGYLEVSPTGKTQSSGQSVQENTINQVWPMNLAAVFDTANGAATINELRKAFQIQRALERDARSGTRYTEMIEAHYGVSNPDSRLQRPEFLGGDHMALNQQQVAQTSATNITGGGTPQGNLAAYSLTSGNKQIFTKSFTEHGYLIIVTGIRTANTYQNNTEKMWNRKERWDFHHPVFNNIGEQPILNKELYASGTSLDDKVFGYQEAWAEYRYKPSKVTGAFNSKSQDVSGNANTLHQWHYAQNFSKTPVLNSAFIAQGYSQIDRTLAIKAEKVDQFMADFFFDEKTTRPMPMYSVPGLIDHN